MMMILLLMIIALVILPVSVITSLHIVPRMSKAPFTLPNRVETVLTNGVTVGAAMHLPHLTITVGLPVPASHSGVELPTYDLGGAIHTFLFYIITLRHICVDTS